MSVRKKTVILAVPLIMIAICTWAIFKLYEIPEPDFTSDNKIELLATILTEDNAAAIRAAGYWIPDDPVIRRWGINDFKIPGKLNLDVRPPTSLEDDELLVHFSTMINGRETDVAFFLDKELNLISTLYNYTEEDGTLIHVEVNESQEKELLEQVQKELNQFFEKMKQQLNSK